MQNAIEQMVTEIRTRGIGDIGRDAGLAQGGDHGSNGHRGVIGHRPTGDSRCIL